VRVFLFALILLSACTEIEEEPVFFGVQVSDSVQEPGTYIFIKGTIKWFEEESGDIYLGPQPIITFVEGVPCGQWDRSIEYYGRCLAGLHLSCAEMYVVNGHPELTRLMTHELLHCFLLETTGSGDGAHTSALWALF